MEVVRDIEISLRGRYSAITPEVGLLFELIFKHFKTSRGRDGCWSRYINGNSDRCEIVNLITYLDLNW